MFGSNGRNAKISRNFGEIPQDDNKMKRKSSRFGANRRKIIDLGAVFLFLRGAGTPRQRRADEPSRISRKLSICLTIRIPL